MSKIKRGFSLSVITISVLGMGWLYISPKFESNNAHTSMAQNDRSQPEQIAPPAEIMVIPPPVVVASNPTSALLPLSSNAKLVLQHNITKLVQNANREAIEAETSRVLAQLGLNDANNPQNYVPITELPITQPDLSKPSEDVTDTPMNTVSTDSFKADLGKGATPSSLLESITLRSLINEDGTTTGLLSVSGSFKPVTKGMRFSGITVDEIDMNSIHLREGKFVKVLAPSKTGLSQ